MKVYIFGGNGFIGRHVAERLVSDHVSCEKISLPRGHEALKSFRADLTRLPTGQMGEKSVVVNLAHAYAPLCGSRAVTNRLITDCVISFARSNKVTCIIHATTQSQYGQVRKGRRLGDRYIEDKIQSLARMEESGIKVIELVIGSAISSSHDTPFGLDRMLKRLTKTPSRLFLVPNIHVNINFAHQIAAVVSHFVTGNEHDDKRYLLVKDHIVHLPHLVKALAPTAKILVLPHCLLVAVATVFSPAEHFFMLNTPLTASRISYYRGLAKRTSPSKLATSLEQVLAYLSDNNR